MAGGKNFIPNQWCWFGFIPGTAAWENMEEVTMDEVTEAIELTSFMVSLNASSQGNTVPNPALDSLWEGTIRGTSQGQYSMDMKRKDVKEDDIAWNTFPRGTVGTMLICRYGVPKGEKPKVGSDIEKWPIDVSSRTASAVTSNTLQTFTVTAGVPFEPNEGTEVVA